MTMASYVVPKSIAMTSFAQRIDAGRVVDGLASRSSASKFDRSSLFGVNCDVRPRAAVLVLFDVCEFFLQFSTAFGGRRFAGALVDSGAMVEGTLC